MTDDASTETTPERRVVRNDEASRYDIFVGDELAGFTEIEPDGTGRVAFPHTEIDSAFGGQGLSRILVRDALADTARRGEIIVPLCSVVRKYLRENEVPGAIVDWPHSGDAQESATPGEQPG